MTKRAKRRLAALVGLAVLFGIILVILVAVRRDFRDRAAAEALVKGMESYEQEDWQSALPLLSKALTRQADNLEARLAFARTRSEVPTEFGTQHLDQALKLYAGARDLAASIPNIDPELLAEAHLGCARLQALGIGEVPMRRLEESAEALWQLDPPDARAIPYFLFLRKRISNYLPKSADLVIRGDSSDEEWLERMSEAGDSSALKWALEEVVRNPVNLESRAEVLEDLRKGNSEELQSFLLGEVRERPVDVAKAWSLETSSENVVGKILLAEELIRLNRLPEAQELLSIAVNIEEKGASSLLRLIMLLDWLGPDRNASDLKRAIDEATERSLEEAAIGIAIVERYWLQGDGLNATRILQKLREAFKYSEEDLVVADLLFGLVIGLEPQAEVLSRFRRFLEASPENLAQAPRWKSLEKLVTACLLEPFDLKRLRDIGSRRERSTQNVLIEVLIGDALQRASLFELASFAFAKANVDSNNRASPVQSRLVNSLVLEGNLEGAFEVAFRFAQISNSTLAYSQFIRIWGLIDQAGLDPKKIISLFPIRSTRYEFVKEIFDGLPENSKSRERFLSQLVEAAISAGRFDEVSDVLDSSLVAGLETKTLIVLGLALAQDYPDRASALIELVRLRPIEGEAENEFTLLEAAFLETQNLGEMSRRVLREHYDANPEDATAERNYYRSVLRDLISKGKKIDADRREIILETKDLVIMKMLLSLAIQTGDEETGARCVESIERAFVIDSPPSIIANGRFVLAFDQENDARRRRVIADIDGLIRDGSSSPRVASLEARLLLLGETPNIGQAIAVLKGSVALRPNAVENYPLLIDLLQRKARFSEAEEVLGELVRRNGEPGVAELRAGAILAMQNGNPGLMLENLRKISERTSDVIDTLRYARELKKYGESKEYEEVLSALYASASRMPLVDLEFARLLSEQGKSEEAIDILRAAPGFDTESDRKLAIARFFLSLGNIDDSARELLGVEESAPAALLGARVELGRSDPDLVVVEEALDRALELDLEDDLTLQENVAIRLSYPELQGKIVPLIARLSRTKPEVAESMLLAVDASGGRGEFSPDQSHLTRAREMIAADPTRLQSWLLATRLYQAYLQREDSPLENAAVETMLEEYGRLLEDAREFFPNQPQFSSSLVWVRRVQGDFVSARDAAATQYRRSPKGDNWNSLRQLCISENQLGNYDQVCKLLIPLKLLIEERFDVWNPLCVCFTRALVESGQFALALDFLTNCKREAADSVPSTDLLAFAVKLDAERAKDLIRFFLSSNGDLENANLLAAASLSGVFALSNDPEARQMGLDLLGTIPSPPAGSLARIQLERIRSSLAGEPGSYEALLASEEMLDQFQPELWELVSQGGRVNSKSEQENLSSFLSPLVISGNNFIALVGEVGSKGLIPASEKAAFCERAMQVEQSLRSIASDIGEFQDSCAMYFRYCGDLDLALQFSTRAVEIAPMKPEFYLTLADTHLEREEFKLATVAAETAFRLLEKAPQKDEKAMKRATEIQELSLESSIGGARK